MGRFPGNAQDLDFPCPSEHRRQRASSALAGADGFDEGRGLAMPARAPSDPIEPFRRALRLPGMAMGKVLEGGIVMQKRWALLTVLIALASGAAAPLLFAQGVRAPLRLSLSCMLLSEAEKAGYLTPDKRHTLIEKLAASSSLPAADRQFVPQLGSDCPKM